MGNSVRFGLSNKCCLMMVTFSLLYLCTYLCTQYTQKLKTKVFKLLVNHFEACKAFKIGNAQKCCTTLIKCVTVLYVIFRVVTEPNCAALALKNQIAHNAKNIYYTLCSSSTQNIHRSTFIYI